jgi:signal transduction histidine kinase/CheY-like chemotaxis protein
MVPRGEISLPVTQPEQELRRWRNRTLGALLWAAATACTAIEAFATFQIHSLRFAIVGAVISAALLTAAVRQQLDFRLRTGILLAAVYAASTASLALGGLSPNILVAMCAFVVMATLLLGRGWGTGLVLFAATTVLVVVPLRNAGTFPADTHISYETPDAGALARVAFAFVLLSLLIVASISYLLARAEELLRENARALETLERARAEQHETDEQLRRTEAAFHKARELEILGRLSSSVAHDFNNALLIFQASIDLARLRPSYVETALNEIGSAIQQAAATTRQLSAFSPQAARPPRVLSLAGALLREAALLERILPANITLRCDVAKEDDELTVLGDEGQIQSLLTNLALNARDAMPDGGTLDVRLRRASTAELGAARLAGSFVAIDVEDDGVGMPRETLEHVFEPFFTTKGAAGTGLGLASVRDVVDRNGGHVHVSSEVGRGTRFTLYWPIRRADATDAAEARPPETTASGTVLVVDDDDDVRRAMTKPLAWRGYTVLEAKSGADALLVARRHRESIDVLCVDLVMPGMPAQQLIDSFRASHPEARVLLCSGYLPEEAGRPFAPVDAFLSKPFSPGALASAIQSLVSKPRERGNEDAEMR